MRLIAIFLLLTNLSAFAADATVKGYLLDGFCYDRFKLKPKSRPQVAAAMHSRECLQAEMCSKGGYGVLTEDDRFIRFDQDGNEKVRKFITGFSRETGIKVTVTGAVDGDKMTVSKIELNQ